MKKEGLMTPEQEKHLAAIKDDMAARIDAKYRKGQQEHGGNLWERNPVKDLDGEIVDATVYFFEIKALVRTIYSLIVRIREAEAKGDWVAVDACLDQIAKLTYPYQI
jgi:hypothetical protein